jgi:hypothetical protein
VLFSRAFNQNDVLHFGFASATRDPGVTRATWDFTLNEGTAPGPNHIINRDSGWAETNVSFSYTVPRAQQLVVYVLGGGEPRDTSHGVVHGLFVSYDPAFVIYCQYGTQITPGGAGLVQLTPALIEAILTTAGVPELGFFFIPLYWSMFSTETLCRELPPPLPSVDLLDPTISFQTRLDIFRAVSWLSFCQCAPGAPTPLPPPPPVIVVPPGTPTAPVFPCDNVDPCAALVNIQQQLAALSSAQASMSQLVTLMQRYSEPFAYIPGAVHSGIHVSGSFAVSRLVGMRVTVVQRPGGERLFSGVPTYISDLGWMSVLTGDGMIDEIRLTRDTQSWFPKLMPLATQFGISLRDGVVVDIQELEAEP